MSEVTVNGANEMTVELANALLDRSYSEGESDSGWGYTELFLTVGDGDRERIEATFGPIPPPIPGTGQPYAVLSAPIRLAATDVDLTGQLVTLEVIRGDGPAMSYVDFVRRQPLAADEEASFSYCNGFGYNPGKAKEQGSTNYLLAAPHTPAKSNDCALPLAVNEITLNATRTAMTIEVINLSTQWIDLNGWAFEVPELEAEFSTWSRDFVAGSESGQSHLVQIELPLFEGDMRSLEVLDVVENGMLLFNNLGVPVDPGFQPVVANLEPGPVSIERCPDPSSPTDFVYVVASVDSQLAVNRCVDVPPPEGALAINEFKAGFGPDAFIELRSTGDEAVSLDGWTLGVVPGGFSIDLADAVDPDKALVETLSGFLILGGDEVRGLIGPGDAALDLGDVFLDSALTLTLTGPDRNVVQVWEVDGQSLEDGQSFQRCETEPGSDVYELRVALDPSPAEDNGCESPPVDPPGDPGYLKASNTGAQDSFGQSVAIDGDTIVVGAPLEDGDGVDPDSDDAPQSGAVYVFVRSGASWRQEAYLKASPSGGRFGGRFGQSVAIDGDVLVVGAPGGEGRAFVFSRSNGVWSREAELSAWNAETGDDFGGSVAISGDLVAVGAVGEDSSATGVDDRIDDEGAFNSGAAYVFRRVDGDWVDDAYLKASNTGRIDRFGAAVALDGELLVVGASEEGSDATGVNGDESNDEARRSGAVYAFDRADGAWSQEAYLKPSYADPGMFFGVSVSLSGGDLAVGANQDGRDAAGNAGGPERSGAVFLFERRGGAWSQSDRLKPPTLDANDSFGRFVALAGDRLLVSAIGDDSDGIERLADPTRNTLENSGAAFLYARSGGWSRQAFIKAPNPDANDFFGTCAVDGDTLVMAAQGEASAATGVGGDPEDDSAPHAGAVYVRPAEP